MYSVHCTCTRRFTVHVQCKLLVHSTEYTASDQQSALIVYSSNPLVNALTVSTIGAQLGPLTAYTLSALKGISLKCMSECTAFIRCIHFEFAHQGSTVSVQYVTCAIYAPVVWRSLQQCIVHLACILSLNSGAQYTDLFVLYLTRLFCDYSEWLD